MSQLTDNLIAYRILTMLVKPFKETAAYKLGIIDDKGNNLRKSNTFKSSEERDAYTYLHRLVFNMKKLINKLPGGESNLKTLVTALFLVKEQYRSKTRSTTIMEERFNSILTKLDSMTLVEEELEVRRFIKVLEDAPVNSVGSGAAVATDQPKIDKKKLKKFQVINRRNAPQN